MLGEQRRSDVPDHDHPDLDYRHLHASVVEVAGQAGHSPMMALNTYGHVIDELAAWSVVLRKT
jgi:hypothetical protein